MTCEPTGDRDEILLAVEKFDRPALGLRASREELTEWAAGGASLDPPLAPEAAIRRMLPVKHLALVKRIAVRRAAGACYADVDDLIGAGQFGLIRAAELYDPAMGYRFSTYAHRWIRQAMGVHARENRHVVRVPVYAQDLVARVRKDPACYRSLTEGQRAAVDGALALMGRGVLDDRDDEGGSTLARVLADDAASPGAGVGADLGALEALMAALPGDRERAIFADTYGLAGREPAGARRLTGRHGVSSAGIAELLERGRRAMLIEADRLGLSLDDCLMAAGDDPRDPATIGCPPPERQYRGVRLRPSGRWAGAISVGRSCVWVGTYRSREQCRRAVDRFAWEHFGIEDYTGSRKAPKSGSESRLGA